MPLKMLPEPIAGVIPVPRAPEGARLTGERAPNGDPVWEMEEEVVVTHADGTPVKDPVLGHDGQPRWIKHQTTGEALYPKLRTRKEQRTRRFTLHIQRNEAGLARGSVMKNYHFEPDPAEKERLEKAQKVRDFQAGLAERAVSEGLTVDELFARLLGGGDTAQPAFSDPVPEPLAAPDADPADYPKRIGASRWALTPEHEAQWKAGDLKLFQGTEQAARETLAGMAKADAA